MVHFIGRSRSRLLPPLVEPCLQFPQEFLERRLIRFNRDEVHGVDQVFGVFEPAKNWLDVRLLDLSYKQLLLVVLLTFMLWQVAASP